MKVEFRVTTRFLPGPTLSSILGEIVQMHSGALDRTRRVLPPDNQAASAYVLAYLVLRGDVSGVAPEERERAGELARALAAWANGETHPGFAWEVKDATYPIDDGVVVEGPHLKVWVNNSNISVTREGDGSFRVSASGSRHSFAANPTGRIGEILLAAGEVTDLVVDSQATMAWDLELRRLFQPTRVAEVRHALEPLLEGSRRSATVERAYQALLAALADSAASAEYLEATPAEAAPPEESEFL